MANWTKKELKRTNREKKRCKKAYSDWADDEFNCGPNKFIFGVIAEESQDNITSFQTLNDLTIYYNRDSKLYILDVDPLGAYNDGSIQYLSNLLNKLKEFVSLKYNVNNINMLIRDNIYTYFEDMSNYWSADNLADLYFKFYIFVQGYKQMLRNKKQNDKIFEKVCDEAEKIGGEN